MKTDKTQKLLRQIRIALDGYYEELDKYGPDYATSELLSTLEYISDYVPKN